MRPDRLCLHLVDSLRSRVLVCALQRADADLLGDAVEDPRTVQLTRLLMPVGLVGEMVAIWREHGLVCLVCEADHQAFSLQCLLRGFMDPLMAGMPLHGSHASEDIASATFAAAVDRVLGRGPAGGARLGGAEADDRLAAAAADMRRLLAERTVSVHALLGL